MLRNREVVRRSRRVEHRAETPRNGSSLNLGLLTNGSHLAKRSFDRGFEIVELNRFDEMF